MDPRRRLETLSKVHPTLKAIMLSKLDESKPWHYVHHPEDTDKESFITTLRNFIETDLEEFIAECKKVLPHLQEADLMSLGGDMTPHARAFYNLYEYLQRKGVPGIRAFGKEQVFWSGQKAKERALNGDLLSDAKIPAIAMLFDLCTAITKTQGEYNEFSRLLSGAVSKLYCLGATGIAHVYLSSDKTTETAGMTTPNSFWSDELPTLRQLMWAKQVTDIHVHLYDHTTDLWLAPKKHSTGEIADIEIRRRSAYSTTKEKFREDLHEAIDDPRFKRNNMKEEEKTAWCTSTPRPAITFGRLEAIAKHWRKYKRIKHDVSYAIAGAGATFA